MLRTGHSSALYTCRKYSCACKHAMLVMLLTPTSKVRERAVNVAGEAWASENVSVHQRAGDIEAHIVVRGIPHYNKQRKKIEGDGARRLMGGYRKKKVPLICNYQCL